MQTLENKTSDKMKSETENAVATVETRVQDVISYPIDIMVVSTMRSVGIFSTPNPKNVVLDPEQSGFSGRTNGLQIAVSSS